ncbi:spore gernimation protein KC [Domibacillus antri]|uniref:Spore gernimation protein KC n=1 Tax=Domibacillus antri TaxID=1714264 RepID=A0A1Q8Q299_9BACI|nr:Ger(x)C family spore germination protein [Domibacillus antri]OLN21438.1 spore gernimation protein KC [Domibacillus antri]
MNRKWMFLLIILISAVFLSGCWSKKELTDLAFISAVGIDKNEDGKYVKTIQIINPGNVAGGLQGGGGGQAPSVSVFTATGDNILEAHFRASTKISRRLYQAHANLVVIGEQLVKEEGITDIFDAFERDPEFRPTTTVVIAHDTKAEDIIKTLTAIDKIPADKVINTLRTTEQAWGENININIQEAINTLESPGKELILTGFRLKGDAEQGKKMENIQSSTLDAYPEADGIAIFKEGKLIDWFHEEESRGTVWILDKMKETDVNINWENEKEAIGYHVIRQKTTVSADVKKGRPKMTIDIRAEGDIREVTVPVNLNDPHVLLSIEKAVEKEIKKEIEKAVQRAQENKSDIFGFGEAVHRSDPKAWKKLKKGWSDVSFPEVQVEVKVNAFIRRTGLRNKSYLYDMEKNR